MTDQDCVLLEEFPEDVVGEHENQLSEGGETELPYFFKKCAKNPGHREFHRASDFTLYNLPEGHRDSLVFDLVQSLANLTIKLKVNFTSENRPEFWPGTKDKYFMHKMRGSWCLRTGSGRISRIFSKTGQPCMCRERQCAGNPSSVWWEINVETATHVVFDESEANHTSVVLFHDDMDSPDITINKVSIEYVDVERDRCVLKFVTCDQDLGEKLNNMVIHFNRVWDKTYEKYKSSRHEDKLTIIVSHPHGCSKMIGVGQWMGAYKANGYKKFTYTTPTCPGSSGATVFCLGSNRWGCAYQRVHSGTLKSGVNYSGSRYENKKSCPLCSQQQNTEQNCISKPADEAS